VVYFKLAAIFFHFYLRALWAQNVSYLISKVMKCKEIGSLPNHYPFRKNLALINYNTER